MTHSYRSRALPERDREEARDVNYYIFSLWEKKCILNLWIGRRLAFVKYSRYYGYADSKLFRLFFFLLIFTSHDSAVKELDTFLFFSQPVNDIALEKTYIGSAHRQPPPLPSSSTN